MTKIFSLACGLLFALLVSASASAQNAQRTNGVGSSIAEQLVKQIESRYGRMRGLAAEFEQTYNAPGMRERRERGRLVLQRPRRMRWEYDPKPGKLFIVNGRDVWFYVPADREAIHADANNVSDARFPFLFLLGQTNLSREFRSITLVENDGQAETRTLHLLPRNASSGLREISLEVYPDGRILKVKLSDEAGAISEVTLTKVRENFIAPADAFEFHPPPGVTVRRQR
ncbi:MAG TPA: outer membrane lipoprotein carrier protein LolA [Pyrinomonadaceae bacterium]|jgi:outer membrane lipoprotein carrier protein|nr:outer membrane lipoprotein carrier protein LolA [Pyrinomonadaceae bacterium]